MGAIIFVDVINRAMGGGIPDPLKIRPKTHEKGPRFDPNSIFDIVGGHKIKVI